MDKTKILPVTLPAPIKSYLPIAIISSIADANLHSNTWIMNNFIQLFKYDCYEKIESFPLQNFIYFDQDFFRVNEFTDQNYNFKRETFIDDVIQWINKGNYVVLYANEYLVPGTRFYHYRHILHSEFIVGYDIERKIFKLLNFWQETNDLEIIDVPFIDLEQAFFDESTAELYKKENVSWNFKGKMHMVELIRFIEKKGEYYDYGLNYTHMLLEMENYLYAKDSSNYTNYFTGHLIGKWGTDVYEEILKILEKTSQKEVDYRMIQLLYEHKLYMKERIALFEGEQKKYAEQYEEVIQQTMKLRLISLKYNCNFSQKTMDKMICLVQTIRDTEKRVLIAFLEEYKKDNMVR